MTSHLWVPSTLGHGETMCSRCFVTNREAAAIGMTECEPPAPKAANENPAPAAWTQERIDDDLADDLDEACDEHDWLEAECGLMDDGQCASAGTEHCDFTCPWRDSEDFAGSEAWRKKHGAATPPRAGGRS